MKKKKIVAILSALAVTSTLVLGNNIKMVHANTLNSKVEAEKIVSEMTLDEKIGQMLMPDFRQWKQEGQDAVQDFTEMNDEVAEIIDEFDLGGVILFAQNVKTTEQTAKLTHDLQQVAINDEDGNLPLLTTIDQEGGIVTRLGTGTNFPGNMAIGATKNEQSSYDTGKVIGRELNSLGINVNFAPSVDVNNNPSNPVIGLRSFSSNPDLVAKLGVKMIEGIQDEGVSAAAKHFPGHGDTATDSHYGLPKVDKSLEELKKVELKPFQAAIDNGVDMIMTAHIQFPQIEKDTYTSIKDGQEIQIPATLSDDILTGLLREDMNFEGVIITDALNMAAISENFGEVEAVKIAFDAGVDIALMPTILRSKEDVTKLREIVEGIKEAVVKGEISEERINESATRIVKLKIDRGIMNVKNDNRTAEEKIANAQSVVGSQENRDIERRVSAEAITVVKNENNVLPLNPKEGEKVLLVAPYDNELPGMRFGLNRLMKEGKVDSVELDTYCYKSQSIMTDELKNKIDEADYVVVLSEMGNYTHLNKDHWITAIPNAVTSYANELNKDSVVVSVGKPYDVAAHPNAKAEVIAYGYKGMDPTEADGGLSPVQAFGPNIPAAIEVVFGAAEARGTLPVSIPTVDENGVANLDINSFEYGYGITNLTSVGKTTIEAPAEVKSGEELELKVNINEIESLKSENYSAKINFNNDAFEVVSVKSADENVEVKNVEVKGSEINVSLSDKDIEKATDSETSLLVTLKAIAEEGQDVIIINSLEIVDSKDRTFNTTLENKYINITKVEAPEEGNKPDNEEKPGDDEKPGNEEKPGNTNKPGINNNGGKLPNTGAVVTPIATGALGLAMTALGFVLNKKRNKNN
ncbi:glycoside hydrolase family 3 N-terminal domain-containing protein [Clostridium sp.]|uniref:glycoside hydrolase family 3 N-terminal domain-containing protein n=1 Tax=Clostridium sp. TaxID=1506 RepID=UPI0025BDE19B|nr:glycoside hydrolase family 3 N-terminal domain-containing protein [Clostridium sp.]